MKAFTLVELLIIFAISSTIAGIGLSSFSSYNRSQVFGSGLTDFSSYLNTAKSRAMSQVKPASCGSNPLDGYEVAVVVSGSQYTMSARCSGIVVEVGRKNLPSQVTFLSGSASSILFNVSTGIVTNPSAIVISGFGRTSTITIDKVGKISVNEGTNFLPGAPTATPTSFAAATPTPITGCSKDYYYVNPYCVFVGANRGQHCDSSCGVTAPTSTPVPTATPIPAGPTATPTQIPTAPTSTPVPTATPVPAATTSIALNSSPNPSSFNQNVVFTATVTGSGCTPAGQIRFYADGVLFSAAGLSGSSNPGIGSVSKANLSIGSHVITASFITGGACPSRNSNNYNQIVQ